MKDKVLIYWDVDDSFLEDGYYRIFKTDSGWSRKRSDAVTYSKSEAQVICDDKPHWNIWEL